MATEKDVSDFNEGIILDDGYKTLPAQLKILKQGDISEVEIQIFEGKFHQIKRMFEAVGKRVRYLRRISMGNIELDGNLKTGEFRELNKEEINMLYKDVR